MKMQRLLLSLSCLLLLAGIGYAQQSREQRLSPLGQLSMKESLKSSIRIFWEGRAVSLMGITLLELPELRAGWDVSEEQVQQIQDALQNMGQAVQENPEYQKLIEGSVAIQMQNPDDPLLYNADEETINRFLELSKKKSALMWETVYEDVDTILTPEQKQKINESLLVSMGELPGISPYMFEALDLTDAQKQEMEKIKKELEPEFEKNLDYFADRQLILMNRLNEEYEKQGGTWNIEDMTERMRTAWNTLIAEDREFKRINDEVQSQSRAFSTQFKTKMFDVLNDEQWKRLQELIDNPPEHTKALLKIMKEQSGESEEGKNPGGGWQPGPGSWRPGDPIPEEYRQERNTRGNFPRQEN